MAQLYFKYGAMNAGKSIEILKVANNYEEQGKRVLLLTSVLDDRSGFGVIASRIGPTRDAIVLDDQTKVRDVIVTILHEMSRLDCILVDEAQFLKASQIEELARVVDALDIPVMCFGLKNDFQNKLFEGTAALLAYADKIEEIKTICWQCSKKATMNLRLLDGKPVYEGEQIQVGGNESYLSVCRKHFFHFEDKKEET